MKCGGYVLNYYKIADLIVAMDSYGRTVRQAEPYLIHTEKAPDVVVQTLREPIKARYPELTDDEAEYLGTGASFYRQLLKFDGIMLHSSAVVVDGKTYLFSAHSGVGKSTHTKLWLDLFGDRALILNDDKPALRNIRGVWHAFGTPWSGKDDLSRNDGFPIVGIAVVERSEHNSIGPFKGAKAVFALYEQVQRAPDRELRAKLLEHLDGLMTLVPVWQLKCNMDPQAAVVAYEAMSGKKFTGK